MEKGWLTLSQGLYSRHGVSNGRVLLCLCTKDRNERGIKNATKKWIHIIFNKHRGFLS